MSSWAGGRNVVLGLFTLIGGLVAFCGPKCNETPTRWEAGGRVRQGPVYVGGGLSGPNTPDGWKGPDRAYVEGGVGTVKGKKEFRLPGSLETKEQAPSNNDK